MTPWKSLGGRLASAPTVTSWAADEMQVFAIHGDGALWNRYWDGEAWHDWESLGGDLDSDPTACSWGPDRLDVFARGTGGDLLHAWWDGVRWSWQSPS